MRLQMDILQATLAANIRVVKYVPSYGDQPNEITHVTKCTFLSCSRLRRKMIDCARVDFRDKFRGYHVRKICRVMRGRDADGFDANPQKRLSPKPRPFYWHETSVIVRVPFFRSSVLPPCLRVSESPH